MRVLTAIFSPVVIFATHGDLLSGLADHDSACYGNDFDLARPPLVPAPALVIIVVFIVVIQIIVLLVMVTLIRLTLKRAPVRICAQLLCSLSTPSYHHITLICTLHGMLCVPNWNVGLASQHIAHTSICQMYRYVTCDFYIIARLDLMPQFRCIAASFVTNLTRLSNTNLTHAGSRVFGFTFRNPLIPPSGRRTQADTEFT